MATERYVRSFDGTELYVRCSGQHDAPPVVLCDGLGCDGFIWRHLKPVLEQRYHVVRWHYRGHGQSKKPRDPHALSIDDLRGDLLAVLDEHGIQEAALFGHSMGVQVVLDFAVTHPERVTALVPVCGSYGRPMDTFHDNGLLSAVFPRLRDMAARFPRGAQRFWSTLMESELSLQFAMHAEVEGKLLSRRAFKPYFKHLASMDVGVFVRMLDRVRTHTVEDRLHEIRVPTLIIAGHKDTFTPAWLSRRMERLIPDAEMLMVPLGTHVAPLEQPELIELRLSRFLDERLGAGRPRPRKRKSARRRTGARKARPRAAGGSKA